MAPAKINLHLSVVGRKPDGYHLLRTLMVKLDLCDRLHLELTGAGIDVAVVGADLPFGEGNLVHRAAAAFFSAAGWDGGVSIVLEKNIPVAAGLGGGSSDAAAVLLGLNQLCGRPLGRETLFDLGLGLGADVPFFLFPGTTAWAEGVGEKLRPGPAMGDWRFLLVNPGWPLSTAWVFKNFNLKLTSSHRNHIFFGLHESSFTINRVLHNDLESVVIPKYPEISRIKELLLAGGAEGAMMTGSGPTVFGIFSNPEQVLAARERVKRFGELGWRAMPAAMADKSS